MKEPEVLEKEVRAQISRTKIVGILNATPDSFYDGGRYTGLSSGLKRAGEMIAEGADIVEIGGESSRPGSRPVSGEEEKSRVLPLLEAIRSRHDLMLSVDTTKSSVAEAALKRGAAMINDISAGRFDPRMTEVLAACSSADVVLMHMKGTPETMQKNPEYGDPVEEIINFFFERIEIFEKAGISRSRIILDPGIGFGKTPEHNLEILRRLGEFKETGLRIMVGHSRKSFLGKILGRSEEERLSGTLAVSERLIEQGADFLRVHDVAPHRDLLKMMEVLR